MTQKYLTVSQLTAYLKRKFTIDPHLQDVWLSGEITGFIHHGNGHMYFKLKDDQTRISAMMSSGYNRHLKFTPLNGQHILVRGTVSLFSPRGEYQIQVIELEPKGIGHLQLAFQQLEKKLGNMGIFDDKHKQLIPKYPTHIGIITSKTGAAVSDIVSTIKRRYPVVQITIIAAVVQGEHSADSIVKAIELANKLAIFNTLILGRGGGSPEDLWSFNEEKVVLAIHHSVIPIISAIGHERDNTLSDYASDYRAPTPTGAAEIAVPSITDVQDRINNLQSTLTSKSQMVINHHKNKLQQLQTSRGFYIPEQLLSNKSQQIDRLTELLRKHFINVQRKNADNYIHLNNRLLLNNPEEKIINARNHVKGLENTLKSTIHNKYSQKKHTFHALIDKLTILNPLQTIKRGFAIPYHANNKIIKSIHELSATDEIKVQVLDGFIKANVTEVEGVALDE